MEATNLQTAATYVNNLLLARGLLRNGKPVKFGELATHVPRQEHNGSKEQTLSATTIVADIINLVHDMLLKRDRDQEHHESLAFTLRSLRIDASRNADELERLKQRNQELRRQLALSESSQRAAETAAKSAEASARTLREEVVKLKALLTQVRTQCTKDLRKRDVQIESLKKHLSERQRGNKTGLTGASITIKPGSIGMAKSTGSELDGDHPSLEDEQYSLRQETTEFLTQLSQNLSDENDSLISLIRSTVNTLKELQGLPHNQPRKQEVARSDPTAQQNSDGGEELVNISEVSYQSLATDLEGVLGSLTDLLTNPSFAPIEEVHLREEEIQRLRMGWEKMESRWHDAIHMMQGWRKRMLSGGDTVKLDELKMGLCLGEGLDSPSRRSFNPFGGGNEADEKDEDDSEQPSGEEHEEEPDLEDLPTSEESLGLEEEPLINGRDENNSTNNKRAVEIGAHVLCETNANERAQSPAIHPSRSEQSALDLENSSPVPFKPQSRAINANVSQARPSKSRLPSRKAPLPSVRASRPARSSPAPVRDLSVEEKLKIADREARRVSSSSPLDLNIGNESAPKKAGKSDSQTSHLASLRCIEKGKGGSSPVKRARIGGRPKRRKSTLSPDELEELMMGR